MKRVLTIALFVSIFCHTIKSQNRYAVYFTDKNQSPFSVNDPSKYLSERSIERRSKWGIPITQSDLPTNPSYVQEIKDIAGVEVFYKSKWLNAILIQCSSEALSLIESHSFVEKTEYLAPEAPLIPNNGRISFPWSTKFSQNINTSVEYDQTAILGIEEMHNDGFTGSGILIANLDAGFPSVDNLDAFSHLFPGKVVDQYDFVENSEAIFNGHPHGTATLSLISAYAPGEIIGSAYNSDVLLYHTEDARSAWEHRVEEFYWISAAERADSVGVDIITASLGYYEFEDASMNYSQDDLDGSTAMITKGANSAFEKGIIVVTSAGNAGNGLWAKITFPGDCQNCLTVGAVNADYSKASFSSIGPTEDGRIKPDVAAPGVGIRALSPSGDITTYNGTSLSAPIIAGLVAGIMEKYPDKNPNEIMDIIRFSSSQANDPDNLLGYGIPNYRAIVNYISFEESTEIIKVFPTVLNRNSDITITVEDPRDIDRIRMDLYTHLGQFIQSDFREFNWSEKSASIQIEAENPGLYFLKVYYNNEVLIRRILLR